MKIEATIISTFPVAVAAIRLPNGICENVAVRPSDAAKRWASSMSKPTRTPFRTAANGRPPPDTPTTSSPRGLGTVTSGIGVSCALNQRSAMPAYTPFCLISARNLLNASLSVVLPLRNPAPIGYEISGSPRTANSGLVRIRSASGSASDNAASTLPAMTPSARSVEDSYCRIVAVG